MKSKLILGAAVLALAACGGSEGGGNQAGGNEAAANQASSEGKPSAAAPAAAPGGGSLEMRPGQYEVTTEMLAFEMPNMPPGMADMMKQQQSQNQKSTSCVTEKDIREAQGGLFTGDEKKECSENSVKMSGGRMGGRLVCGSGAETSTMEVAGTYTADGYEVQMTMSAQGAKVRSRTVGRRVGDCPAGEAAEG